MVARAMYILPAGERQTIRLHVPAVLAVALCAAMVIALAYPHPLLDLAWTAAKGFLAAGGSRSS